VLLRLASAAVPPDAVVIAARAPAMPVRAAVAPVGAAAAAAAEIEIGHAVPVPVPAMVPAPMVPVAEMPAAAEVVPAAMVPTAMSVAAAAHLRDQAAVGPKCVGEAALRCERHSGYTMTAAPSVSLVSIYVSSPCRCPDRSVARDAPPRLDFATSPQTARAEPGSQAMRKMIRWPLIKRCGWMRSAKRATKIRAASARQWPLAHSPIEVTRDGGPIRRSILGKGARS
jgi:hypothetical protein